MSRSIDITLGYDAGTPKRRVAPKDEGGSRGAAKGEEALSKTCGNPFPGGILRILLEESNSPPTY